MVNPGKNVPQDIVIKLTKIKDKYKLLKITVETRKITYKIKLIMLSLDFSAETLQARRE